MSANDPTKKTALPAAFADVLDVKAIERLRLDYGDVDGAFLTQMIEAFVEESRSLQRAAKDADNGDVSELRKVAHRVKSAAGTLGARHVQSACAELEAAAGASDLSRVREILRALPSAIVRARAALVRVAVAARSP